MDSESQNYDPQECPQYIIDLVHFFSGDIANVPTCIFKVPNSLRDSKPEAYIPQVVGLGLLHHQQQSKTAATQMYKYKVAIKLHEGFGQIPIQALTRKLQELAPSIRGCYQTYIAVNDNMVSIIMAIDGLFLFKLLCCYGIGKDALTSSNFLCGLVDNADRRLYQDGIIRDSIMLENQIPIFVLETILLNECSDLEAAQLRIVCKENFPQILLRYCRSLSPLKALEEYPPSATLKRAHLLDLLYDLIILKEPPEEPPEQPPTEPQEGGLYTRSRIDLGVQALQALKPYLPTAVRSPVELVQGFLQLPWSTIDTSSIKTEDPDVLERLNPTASDLCNARVKFGQAEHITAIEFDRATTTLKLPFLKLGVNSEVIIRNLVAYEVMSKSESDPFIFTRYTELMSGIIKTAKDVAVLKEHKILECKSIPDDEVPGIFTGSKPASSAEACHLDEVIKDVNDYYNGLLKVKVRKFMRRSAFTLWPIIKLVAAILILVLLALQTICSVYSCPRGFGKRS